MNSLLARLVLISGILISAPALTVANPDNFDWLKDTLWSRRIPPGFEYTSFSPDGKYIFGHSGWPDTITVVIDAKTGNRVRDIPGNGALYFFAGNTKAVHMNGLRAEVIDGSSLEAIDTMEVPDSVGAYFLHYALSGNERYFAATTSYGFNGFAYSRASAYVWDLQTRRIVAKKTFLPERGGNIIEVDGIGLSSDGHLMAISHVESRLGAPVKYEDVDLYDVNSLAFVKRLSTGTQVMSFHKYSPHGKYMVLSTDSWGAIYDAVTFEKIRDLGFPLTMQVDFSLDDEIIAVTSQSDEVGLQISEVGTGRVIRYVSGGSHFVSLSPDCKSVVTGGGPSVFLLPFDRTSEVSQDEINVSGILYPNPTTGHCVVTFRTTTAEQVTFSIADILGNTVVSFEPAYFAAGSNQFSFDVLNLPQGQYSLMGKVGEVIIENRVIVKR